MNTDDNDIKNILTKYKNIAVIGMSEDQQKPSYRIPLFMNAYDYSCVGINPSATHSHIGIFQAYKNLKDVPPEQRVFINVFRRPEHIPQIVDEIITLGGAQILWLQLGISHPEAERRAESAGLLVVSNRCLKIEYARLISTF